MLPRINPQRLIRNDSPMTTKSPKILYIFNPNGPKYSMNGTQIYKALRLLTPPFHLLK